MREYIRRDRIGSVLLLFIRVLIIVGVILVLDVVGAGAFLLYRGQWSLFGFAELVIMLLLLEGSLISAAGGGLAFFGYVEYWSAAIMISGVLLVLIGLLVSFATSV